MHPLLYPLSLIIPAFVCGLIAHHAWRLRQTPAALPFAVLMAAVAWWSGAYAFELATPVTRLQLLCTSVEYFGIVTIPVAWLLFCLQYAGFGELTTRPRVAALSVLPVIILLAVWTNPWHRLFYVTITPVNLGWLHTWTAVHGPFYWINVAYSYALVLTGVALMYRTLLHSIGQFRAQSTVMVLAAVFPWGTNVAYHLGFAPLPGLDVTPYAFIVSGAAIAWGLFRMRLLEVLPIARGALFDAMGDAVVVVDETGCILDANAQACRIFSEDTGLLRGSFITRLLPDWEEALASQAGEEHQHRVELSLTGTQRIYELRLFPLDSAAGEPRGHLLFLRDITVSEAARLALRDTEVSYRDLFDTVGEAVYVLDAEGCFIDINHGAERMYGYPREDCLGQTPEFLAAPGKNDMETVAHHIALAMLGEPQQFEFWGRRVNGEVFPKEVRLYKGRYLQREVVIAIAVDLTERHQAEEAQRLAAVGQLAAGVAHEFNNLLAAMLLRAEMVTNAGSPEARELVDVVIRSARRGGETCSNLLAFASPKPLERTPVRLETPLDSALLVARRQIENAQVLVVRENNAPQARVFGDAGQIEQVFLNLIINACHAMSDPAVSPASRRLQIRTTLAGSEAQREVVISFSDTGVGIAPENLSRVFEPFFTTRASMPDTDRSGTGLGLSVSHGIINAHGGRFEVSSTPGQGADFIVRLPLHDLTPAGQEEAETLALPRQVQPVRVLLAEDEKDVRRPVYEALRHDGHEVVPVETTEDAVAALADADFGAVITDLMLPGEGGEAILRCAAACRPRPVTIAITGKLDPQLAEHLQAAGADRYLQKPFSLAKLRETLGELLDRAAASSATDPVV